MARSQQDLTEQLAPTTCGECSCAAYRAALPSSHQDAAARRIGHRIVADTIASTDPETWPNETVILRGGIGDAEDLARKLDVAEGGWSVQADLVALMTDLAKYIPNNRFRRTTVGELQTAGGHLAITPGPGYHRSVRGISPDAFDSILGDPEVNPVPPHERWPNG